MGEKKYRSLLLAACIGVLLEFAGRIDLFNVHAMPLPSEVLQAWWKLIMDGILLDAIAMSLRRIIVGFTSAVCFAVGISIILTSSRVLRQAVMPIAELLRHISPLAWIPLAILTWGVGGAPYFVVFIAAFWPIFLSTISGFESVEQRYLDTARWLGATRWMCLTNIVWPAAKPWVVSGVRVGLGNGWMSVIAAELIGVHGLGYLIQVNRFALRMDNVVAVMFTIGAIGYLMNELVERYARWSMPWQTTADSRYKAWSR